MKDERIDSYIMGMMSNDERLSFEQELIANPELQKEVALHQDMVLSIQMKGAKEYARKERSRRRSKLVLHISSTFAMAACLIVGIFHFHNVSEYRVVGAECLAELIDSEGSRGGVNTDAIIAKIDSEEFKEALAMIENEQSRLSDDDPLDILDREELEWYKAITYMRMGKWIKARILLKQMTASSNAYYRLKAQEALDKL